MGTIQCTVCLEDFQTPINCEFYVSEFETVCLCRRVHALLYVCIWDIECTCMPLLYLVQTYRRQWMYTATGSMLAKGTIEHTCVTPAVAVLIFFY